MMLLHVLAGLVFTCILKQLDATTVDFLDLCGDITRSYHRLVYQSDTVYVNINSKRWTDPTSLTCTVIFRADNTEESLNYEFTKFSLEDIGTSLTLETKDSIYYTTEGTYDLFTIPTVFAEKRADTYLKLTLKRTSTESNTYISINIKNRGSNLSIGSIMGVVFGIGFIITAVIFAAFLRSRARMRRSTRRIFAQNGVTSTTTTATTTARRPPGVHRMQRNRQQPLAMYPGYPPTEGAPQFQIPANNGGYQPMMVAPTYPQQVNYPPNAPPEYPFPSGVPGHISLPPTAPPGYQHQTHGYQSQSHGYLPQPNPTEYQPQTTSSGNPPYSTVAGNEPPPSYEQAIKHKT